MFLAHPFAVIGVVTQIIGVLIIFVTAWSVKHHGRHRILNAVLLNVEDDNRGKNQFYRGVGVGVFIVFVGIVFYVVDMWLAP